VSHESPPSLIGDREKYLKLPVSRIMESVAGVPEASDTDCSEPGHFESKLERGNVGPSCTMPWGKGLPLPPRPFRGFLCPVVILMNFRITTEEV